MPLINLTKRFEFVKTPCSPCQEAIFMATGAEVENPRHIVLMLLVLAGGLAFMGAGAPVIFLVILSLPEMIADASPSFKVLREIEAHNENLAPTVEEGEGELDDGYTYFDEDGNEVPRSVAVSSGRVVTDPPALPVGNQTRLNAIPVQSTPAPQPYERGGAIVAARTALSEILASPYKTRVIFGAQRSGKSMLAAIATNELSKQGTLIFHLNLLSYCSPTLDEDATYTRHMVKSVRGDLSVAEEHESNILVGRAINLIQEWHRCYEPSILVVDEWSYLASKNAPPGCKDVIGLIAGKVAALASSSQKRCKAVYALAPLMVAGDMEDSGKAIKTAQLCYVTVSPSVQINWNGQAIKFDRQLLKQVQNNFDGMDMPSFRDFVDVDRIAFVDGQWMKLGTNPSMLNWEEEGPVVKQVRERMKSASKSDLYGAETETELAPLDELGLGDDGVPSLDDLLDEFTPPSTVKVDATLAAMERQPDLRYQCLAGLLKAIRNKGLKSGELSVKEVNGFNWAKVWNDGSKGQVLVQSRDLAGFAKWLNAIAKMGFLESTDNSEEFKITLS